MKKSAISALLASLLLAGTCSSTVADSKVMEKSVSVNVELEHGQGGDIDINLDGTEYNVHLSSAALKDDDIRQAEIAYLPEEVQKIVHEVFNRDKGFEFITSGDDLQVISKIIQHGDDDGAGHKVIIKKQGVDEDVEWVTSGDTNVMVLSDLHEKSSTDGERRVMVIKTELEGEGDIGVADLIISLIKSKPLSDSDKQKIRDALN